MKQFTPEQKHEILLEYQPFSSTHSFSALALRHNVSGGMSTVKKWFDQWNGTIISLQRKKGGGRPRILTPTQVKRHIQPRIRSKNRSHTPVTNVSLLPQVQSATHKHMSIRTLQRYTKKDLHTTVVHGKKRTSEECKFYHTHSHLHALLLQ